MMLDDEMPEIPYEFDQTLGTRRGIDLATTLERIEKNFVITDPRLPDNPIVKLLDIIPCKRYKNMSKVLVLD